MNRSQEHTLLVATQLLDKNSIGLLSEQAGVVAADSLREEDFSKILPSVDCMMVFAWPQFLTPTRLNAMKRLRFIQTILAGVNNIPFKSLRRDVIVCSNAGAYSDEVAEHAWGLLLSSAKRIVEQDLQLRRKRAVLVRHGDAAKGIYVLKGKTLGILGFGGIGVAVARVGAAFGMRIYAFSRKPRRLSGVRMFSGRSGLNQVLHSSDALVLSLPLTRLTRKLIDRRALSKMRRNAILVNIGRGELVDQSALFRHLKNNPEFRFATDVWWYKNGKESPETEFPFASLPNFIGTLHVSGPSAVLGGRPVTLAVENTLLFLTGKKPRNVVDRADYID